MPVPLFGQNNFPRYREDFHEIQVAINTKSFVSMMVNGYPYFFDTWKNVVIVLSLSITFFLNTQSQISSSFWVFKDYCHLSWTLISDSVNGRKLDMAISVAYLKSWIESMVVYMPSNDPTIRSECRVKGWNCLNSAHIFHIRYVCKFVAVVARIFVCWALLLRHLFRILSSLYASN